MIFVFGSNLAGRHSRGSAHFAILHHGAIYGVGEGIQGQSYAIPTKDLRVKTLPLHEIARHVSIFLHYAREHPNIEFQVTAIGCGLAGYTPKDIAPMFKDAPENCFLPEPFLLINQGDA